MNLDIFAVARRLHRDGIIHFPGCGIVGSALGDRHICRDVHIDVRFYLIIKRDIRRTLIEPGGEGQVKMGIGRPGQDIFRILTKFYV